MAQSTSAINRVQVIGNRNVFYDCSNAIAASNYVEVDVLNANIYSDRQLIVSQPLPAIGMFGIYAATPVSAKIDIGNNNIFNVQYGVGFVAEDITTSSPYTDQQFITGTVEIHDNLIQAALNNTQPTNNEDLGIGIFANNAMNFSGSNVYVPPLNSGATINVHDNHLHFVDDGIDMENWYNFYFTVSDYIFNLPVVESNFISLNPIFYPNSSNHFQYGIYQTLDWNGGIGQNNIQGFGNTYDGWFGIYCADNVSQYSGAEGQNVICNTATNTGTGIGFYGDQTGTKFWNNTMAGTGKGFVLDNAMLGTQGAYNINLASTNYWPTSTYNTGQYKTFTKTGSDPNNTVLTIDPAFADEDPESQGPTYNGNDNFPSPLLNLEYSLGNGIAHITGTNTNTTICVIPASRFANGGNGNQQTTMSFSANNQIGWLERLVMDSVYYSVFADEQFTNAQYRVYRMLDAQPSLKDSSSILQNFYTAAHNGNIGTFSSVENAIAGGQLTQAVSSLAGITPQNGIESNYKNYYNIYLDYKNNVYSSTDSILLKSLVYGCPVRDGMAVHKARLLNGLIYKDFTLYADTCTDELAVRKSKMHINSDNITLYPNPTTGDVWVRFDKEAFGKTAEISIFDLVGGLVYTEKIKISDSNKITPDLNSGTYFISIKSNNASINNYNGKITVIK